MSLWLSRLAALPLTVSLTSCGYTELTRRETNPVIGDPIRGQFWHNPRFAAVSTTAGRRTIFVRYASDNLPEFVCAEPPPDALDAFASAAATAVRASGRSSPVPADVQAQFSRAFATGTAPMLYRSQGLQFYRDSLSSYCTMAMKGHVNNDQYFRLVGELRKQAVELIKAEMSAIKVAAGREVKIVSAQPPAPPPLPSPQTPQSR